MKRTFEVEIDEGELINELLQYEEREFLSFMFRLLDAKTQNHHWFHFMLAVKDREEQKLYLVADGGENWVPDATLCQFGTCQSCGSKQVSWAKNAVCEFCSGDVYLT